MSGDTMNSALQCVLFTAGQNDAGESAIVAWPGPSSLLWCPHAGLHPGDEFDSSKVCSSRQALTTANKMSRAKQPASSDLRSFCRHACRLQQGEGPHTRGRTRPAPTPQGQGSTLPTTHALTDHTTAAAGAECPQGAPAPAWGAAAERASAGSGLAAGVGRAQQESQARSAALLAGEGRLQP